MRACASTSCRAGRRAVGVAARDSDTEREADQMAAQAMAGGPVHGTDGGGDGSAIYRQCADCEADEEEMQLSAETGTASVSRAARNDAAQAVAGGGRALPADVRSYFEPRFGADLSDVRIHTDTRAGRAASAINARAYTKGRDIAFAPGRFQPGTERGQHLIAHELAHTQQNQPGLMSRQEADDDDPEALDIDPTHGGNTEIRDTLRGRLRTEGSRVRGRVRRREIAPETETQERQLISTHTTDLEFDTEACEIVMPFAFGFQLMEEDETYCQGARMEGEPDLAAIGRAYVAEVNAGLNNQFKARITGCENDCADRDIPIRIEAVHDDDADDAHRINVIPRSGQSSSRHLCVGSGVDDSLVRHEAGHQVLGRGDEYEASAAQRRRTPKWGRDERVRGGYNTMGSRSRHGRFGVFHRRDYQHVLPFLRAVFPDCEPELIGIPQINIEARIVGRIGFGQVGGRGSFRGGLGVGMGIPLTRDRAWILALEAHADYMEQLDTYPRRFVLAGLRAGIEYQFGGPNTYGRVFGGAGGGLSRELGGSEFIPGEGHRSWDPRTSGFAEGFGGIGVGFAQPGGAQFLMQVQGAGGGEIGGDDNAVQWFNVGVGLGARF